MIARLSFASYRGNDGPPGPFHSIVVPLKRVIGTLAISRPLTKDSL